MQASEISWPPEYRVRTSLKAKYIRLTICKYKGLEVILPNNIKNFNILPFLEEKKLWILKHLAVTVKQPEAIAVPQNIQFPLLQQNWDIIYQNNSSKPVSIKAYSVANKNNKLIIAGDLSAEEFLITAIIKWCKMQAKAHLPILLNHLATQHKLLCNNITVKSQRTLWGSCSSNNNINLNYKLLFLPEHLATHVMLHELAHIRYKHHKTKFWELLAKLDPLCKQHDKMLRTAEQLMPEWV